MDTSFDIKEPLSYSVVPVIILAILFVGGGIFFLAVLFKNIKNNSSKNIKVVDLKPEKIINIKRKYVGELEKIYNAYNLGKLDVRSAYQKMSICVRKFVFEMTGIKVQNYTLQDIKKLNMPALEALISDFYNPEFNKNATANFEMSIMNTKRVIEEWN